MNTSNLQKQYFLKHIAQTSQTPLSLNINRAKGVYLIDYNHKKYIDFISGISVSNIGHNNPSIQRAIIQQIKKHQHVMVYGEYILSPQTKLAKKLTSLLPNSLNTVFFVNSGSEAVEGALKLAKRYTGKTKIIAAKNAYHGSTHGALSLMSNEYFKNKFRPLLPDIFFIEFNNIESLKIIDDKTACVIIEPIQAEAGIILPDKKFLEKKKKKCKKHNCLLMFDEIQTGIGRTGSMFAFETLGVIPDVLILGKALGGGLPLGAFIADKSIMQTLSHNPVLGHITTFGGHPLSCCAGLASIKYIEKNDILKKSMLQGEYLFNGLKKIIHVSKIRGKGLLYALEFESNDIVLSIMHECIKNGLITDWFLHNDKCLRICPPLIIRKKEIDQAIHIISKAIQKYC